MASLGLERLPDEPKTAGRSLIDEIREDYERAEQAPKTLDIAIRNSKLGVRYKALDDTPPVDEDTQSILNVDVLIAAIDCIIVRDPDSTDWMPFEPNGTPVKFDAELADALGWTCSTARDVALKAFSTIPAPMGNVNAHVIELSEWMNGERDSREKRLLGES